MRWTSHLVALLLVCLSFLSCPQAVTAQLTLYDDFNDPSNLVRADKWRAFVGFSFDRLALDSLHLIDNLLFATPNPKLLIVERIHIPVGTFGFSFFGYAGFGGASAVQAGVTLAACTPAPGIETSVRIQMTGFHDSTPADGSLGDIFGGVGVRCPPTGGAAELFWLVVRCGTSFCGSNTVLGTGVLGPGTLGQEHIVRIEKLGNHFRFTADTFPPQDVAPPGATATPPNVPFFDVISEVRAETAQAGGDLVVIGRFDDFMIAP